jgi:pyruvate dehydrogenase E2 component (dihydrolipoamide acetyltransferase)
MAAPQPQAVDDKDEHPAAVAASRQNVAADSAAADSAAADWGRLRVSPAARRMARAHGLDLAPLAAAKGAGRVTSEDVARAVEKRRVAQRRLLLSANQRVMAARMTQSAQETPQFSVAIHVEAGPLLEVKQALTATGGRVSLTALLAHLLGRVILKHPLLNARFDGDAITIFETANIGVAVAAPGGLVVPVLHGVERMALGDVGRRLGELAAAARAGVLTPDEVSGGTFTLSNLGMYGVSAFVPLVNPPQSAILGVAAVEGVVVPSEGGTRHVQRMTLTLSADHRVVDGAYAAAFLQELRAVIEEAQIG